MMQQNRPKSSATAVLKNKLKTNILTRSLPDVYGHHLQQIQFLFIIWTSIILIYVTIYTDDAPFPKSLRFSKAELLGFG